MNLFYKPKNIKIKESKLKYKCFNNLISDYSSCLDKHVFDFFDFKEFGYKLIIKKVLELENDDGFRISVNDDEIKICSKTESGAYYGCLQLKELFEKHDNEFEIEDKPDLKTRGVMVDISRSKVPKLDTLKQMVKFFSKLRYNHLQLYIEGFSFEYKSFPNVLAEKNYITLDEYLELEKYANEHYIDFVPNQNGFGHMADWLEKDEYKHLAECPEGFYIWGSHRAPTTLDPTNNESIELVKKMYKDMLPYVKSNYFNMNFDEPYELGHGKSKTIAEKTSIEDVYIEYFNKLADDVKSYGKIPMLWGDVIIHKPDKLDKLPKDAVFIDWGYDKDYPFEKHAKILEKQNIRFMLAPGTSTWSTITSRILDMEQTILNSTYCAKKYNAEGVIVTDWGDIGHLQYLPVSYLGFILGGLSSWSKASLDDAFNYLKKYLNDDALSEAIMELGKYHLLEGEYRGYGSRLFSAILWAEHSRNQEDPIEFYKTRMFVNLIDKNNIELLKISFDKVEKLLAITKEGIVSDEMKNSLFLLNNLVSINEKLSKLKDNLLIDFDDEINKLEQYLIEHKRLWLMRNIEFGYIKSANRIKWLMEILTKIARKGNLC